MSRKEVPPEDWIRVHRHLASAEREFTRTLERFGRGEISKQELVAAKAPLQALRALAAAVTSKVLDRRGREESARSD